MLFAPPWLARPCNPAHRRSAASVPRASATGNIAAGSPPAVPHCRAQNTCSQTPRPPPPGWPSARSHRFASPTPPPPCPPHSFGTRTSPHTTFSSLPSSFRSSYTLKKSGGKGSRRPESPIDRGDGLSHSPLPPKNARNRFHPRRDGPKNGSRAETVILQGVVLFIDILSKNIYLLF